MSAYYCLRCNNHRDTFDCPPGEIYGELACEFCTDDFEMALEEYTTAAEVLERECKNCRHINGEPCDTGQWCEHPNLFTWTQPGFGCTLFEAKQ